MPSPHSPPPQSSSPSPMSMWLSVCTELNCTIDLYKWTETLTLTVTKTSPELEVLDCLQGAGILSEGFGCNVWFGFGQVLVQDACVKLTEADWSHSNHKARCQNKHSTWTLLLKQTNNKIPKQFDHALKVTAVDNFNFGVTKLYNKSERDRKLCICNMSSFLQSESLILHIYI